MSSDATPISPGRFAEAIKELPMASLHLKVLELRNSIAHLDYSNEQLRPFAEGKEAVYGEGTAPQPDKDCIDAIKENEAVIERMQERIQLVRVEVVENRGASWTEFESIEEKTQTGEPAATDSGEAATASGNAPTTNGEAAPEARSSLFADALRDGVIQMGVIRNGVLQMDDISAPARTNAGGGSLTDEQLRRALEERMRLSEQEDEDGDGGLHL